MARLKGILKMTGSIDQLVVYKLDGKLIVRSKPNVPLSRRRNAPEYEGTRMNQKEFVMASQAGKLFRQGLGGLQVTCCDKYLYRRVTKLMTQIKDLDLISKRGERTVSEGLKHHGVMKLFNRISFDNVQTADKQLMPYPELSFKNRTITLLENQSFVWPKKANKVKLQAHFMQLDFSNKHTQLLSSSTEILLIHKPNKTPIELHVAGNWLKEKGHVFALLQLSFLKDSDHQDQLLNKGGKPLLMVVGVQ